MVDSDSQKQQFHERIDRIQTRLLEEQPPRKVRRPVQQRPVSQLAVQPTMTELSRASTKTRRGLPFAGQIAFLVGITVMLVANIIAMRTSDIGDNVLAEFLTIIGPVPIAVAMLIMLIFGFGMRRRAHLVGLGLGLAVMYLAEPYIAYTLPDLWAQMYTAEHFDTMMVESGLRLATAQSL